MARTRIVNAKLNLKLQFVDINHVYQSTWKPKGEKLYCVKEVHQEAKEFDHYYAINMYNYRGKVAKFSFPFGFAA